MLKNKHNNKTKGPRKISQQFRDFVAVSEGQSSIPNTYISYIRQLTATCHSRFKGFDDLLLAMSMCVCVRPPPHIQINLKEKRK